MKTRVKTIVGWVIVNGVEAFGPIQPGYMHPDYGGFYHRKFQTGYELDNYGPDATVQKAYIDIVVKA